MKYYRTYIVTFETSTGIKYYAGKRVSKYKDPKDDPYVGSGKVITNAINKYGRDCIKSIDWFEHVSPEDQKTAEIELISETKLIHGSKCVNLAKGGEGGDLLMFAPQEIKSAINSKRTETHRNRSKEQKLETVRKVKETKNNRTDEQKALESINKSLAVKKYRAEQSPEQSAKHNAKVSESNKIVYNNTPPEIKEARIDKIKAKNRKLPIWHEPLFSQLLDFWEISGRPKCMLFRRLCRDAGFGDYKMSNLIDHFWEISGPAVISHETINAVKEASKSLHREATTKSNRRSEIWHEPLFSELFDLWVDSGKPKYPTFGKICKERRLTENSVIALVNHFNEITSKE